MKILHLSDIHLCAKHFEWVNKALAFAVKEAIENNYDIAVLSGDIFDATMPVHEPAVSAAAKYVSKLLEHMPVLVLYGTLSHDRPGSLDFLRHLAPPEMLRVVDKPERILVATDEETGRLRFESKENGVRSDYLKLRICAMPGLNKAQPEIMDVGAQAWATSIFKKWGAENAADLDRFGLSSILVTHGTATGSKTESNFAMVAPDHEFTLEALASAECHAVMLGHIHKHQSWAETTPSGLSCTIAYPGSLARLVFGHNDRVGFLQWFVTPNGAEFTFHETPSRDLVHIEFNGPPDMDELRDLAADVGKLDHVRVRWNTDEEHAFTIDKDEMRRIFAKAGGLKLEGTVNPIQSVRASGISRAVTIEDKIAAWAETTGDQLEVPRMVDNLTRLRSEDPEQIIKSILEQVNA